MTAADDTPTPWMDRDPVRIPIVGLGVSAVNLERAMALIESWIVRGQKRYVCVTGAHGVTECRTDPALRAIHDGAGLVVPDGMPLVFMAKALGFSDVSRVYGPDLMRALTKRSADRGYRQFYYGGPPGVADEMAARLRCEHRALQVAGTISPPFRPVTPEEEEKIIQEINSAAPDIVWVGLSTPKQERWMHEHRYCLTAPVLIGVGAAFDFLAGGKAQAPRWMQTIGLEWLFRLGSEPRRLWPRYVKIVPAFAVLAFAQLLRHHFAKSRPPDSAPLPLRGTYNADRKSNVNHPRMK